MQKPLYTARKKFGPADGERWQKFVDWAKILALREVVSLDVLCCEHLIEALIDEDWEYVAEINGPYGFFEDLDYMLKRVGGPVGRNILAVYSNPESHISTPPAPGFVFVGYDLIEDQTAISALVNCGGFPDAFSNSELNAFGLLTGFDDATRIQKRLTEKYPDEPHANCAIYGLWRLEGSG